MNDLTLSDLISSFSATPNDTASDTSSDIDIYSTVLFGLSDISLDTATLSSLAFIGGNSVHQLWKHTFIYSECVMCWTENKYLHLDDPPDSKYKMLEFTDRGDLKWPSDIVIDAVVLFWKIFRLIVQDNDLLIQFVSG